MVALAAAPVYDPSPIQREFHACQANIILLGGAAGIGKSLALTWDPWQTQIVYEHGRWERGDIRESLGWALHIRREIPRLEQTIARAIRLFPLIDPGVRYDSQKHIFTWSCGYRQQFGHIAHDADMTNYLSNEYTHIAWDELAEFDNMEVFDFVNSRLRTADPELQKRLRIVAASNPTGNWVRDFFVAPCKEGRALLRKRVILDDGTEVSRTRIFIPGTLKDNPDPGFRRAYEEELQDKPAHIRRALLYGDWWVVAGAFFADEFTPDHVVAPFRIPGGWNRFRSMDWGFKSKGAVLWWAVNKDGDMVCYRELTFQKMDAGQLARRIRDIEEANGEWDANGNCSRLSGPADTQIWEQRGTIGPTIAEEMSQVGVWWEKATKNRHASVQQFLKRLHDRSGEGRVPAIRFFENCKDTVRTVPAIGTDPKDDELPVDGGDDHWLDAVLYACMYRVSAAKRDEYPAEERERDELEEERERRRRQGQFGTYGFKFNRRGRR